MDQKIEEGGPSVATLLGGCGVTKSGWMLRKGTIFWNKRYCVVQQSEAKLYYFRNELDPSPHFVVNLADGVSIQEEPSSLKKNYYLFSVNSKSSSLLFACENSKEQEEWMKALVEAGVDMEQDTNEGMQEKSIFDFTCKDIDGNEIPLSKYKDNLCLVLNVATK